MANGLPLSERMLNLEAQPRVMSPSGRFDKINGYDSSTLTYHVTDLTCHETTQRELVASTL